MNILNKLFGKEDSEKTTSVSGIDRDQAKQMFFDNACNLLYMSHDRAGDEHRKLGITGEQEKIWRDEFISLWSSKLSVEDLEPLDMLRNAYAVEALQDLVRMADQGDSYARLNYANSIWFIIEEDEEMDNSLLQQYRHVAIDIWTALVKEDIWISENHKAEISKQSMKALQASTPEEYVRNYAQRQLDALY